jgi:hypothetical protein
MFKYLYIMAMAFGFGLLVYFYAFNFDNMSETELVDSILYWYVPLIFGVYGLMALRIKSKMGDEEISPIKFLFTGKDTLLLILVILIGCGGLLGLLLLLIPLAFFKVSSFNFDLKVALVGTGILVLLLYVFFKVLWPAL